MDAIIRVTSRLLFPLIIIFGIYVALFGHLSPGGAFPAGVLLASGFVLLLIVFERGDEEYKLLEKFFTLRCGAVLLLLTFIIHILGQTFNSYLLGTQKFLELWSGGFTILLNNVSMFFIFTAIFVIVYSMVKEC